MNTQELQNAVHFAIGLAKKAGQIHLKWRAGAGTIHWKADKTPVTEADIEVDELVRNEIDTAFPNHGIYTEEGNEKVGNPRWIVDPVDGTFPFSRGYADDFCVNIALEENGVLQFGITYAAAQDRLYSAVRGQGAFCNDQRISGSKISEPAQAVIYIGSGKKKPLSDFSYVQKAYELRMLHIRTGCHGIMLANAARGTIDAFLSTDAELEDIASTAILAQEAGLKVTNERGEPWDKDRFCLAANAPMHLILSGAFGLPTQ